MANEATSKLMAQLIAWIDNKRGKQAELSRALDVPRQTVSDWIKGKSTPRLEQGLQIVDFLKKQRK